MTPAAAIAALDHQIAAHGQSISFRRGATIQGASGFVRGLKPEQLVGMLTQADRSVVVSPSSLEAYTPKADDDFLTNGALGKVKVAEPIHMGSTIIRWNLTVTMA